MSPHDVPAPGGGEGASSECDQLAHDLQSLESSLALFQTRLASSRGPDGPGTEREMIRSTIALIVNEISAVEAQLRNAGCLGSIPQPSPLSPVQIFGVEATQAIQYFRLTGQASFFAPDNSVPLIAQKPLILRVYARLRNIPGASLVSQITGTVIINDDGPTLTPINGPIPISSSTFINRNQANSTLNFLVPAAYCADTVVFKI